MVEKLNLNLSQTEAEVLQDAIEACKLTKAVRTSTFLQVLHKLEVKVGLALKIARL